LDEGAERAADVARRLAHAPFEDIDALCEASAGDGRAQVKAAVAAARRRQAREGAERRRVESMYALQSRLGGDGLVLGIDEVGRGAVAGPLCVAAVALPRSPFVWGVNDSKRLSPKRREELATRIAELALAIGIAYVEPESIDALGMGQCLRMAMRMAIEDSHVDPDAVLIDGNPVHVHPAERCIVKGRLPDRVHSGGVDRREGLARRAHGGPRRELSRLSPCRVEGIRLSGAHRCDS
jgi:ribonuclease HII